MSARTSAGITRPIAKPRRRHLPPAVGPYSKDGAVALLDGRSRSAMFMKEKREQLTQHIGGNPNTAQAILIERAVRLMLQLEMMDEKYLVEGKLFESTDYGWYCSWNNGLVRTLRALGIEPTAVAKPATLADVMARKGNAA